LSESFTVWVRLPDGTVRSFEVGAEEYILGAARRVGLHLPSVCEQGWCISCAARIVTGEVDQSDSRRYYAQDREARFALLCTAKPRTDLRIVSHQSVALRQHRDLWNLPAPRGT
jgi:ferredoxin